MRLIVLADVFRVFSVADVWISVPEVFAMTERGVEHFSFAVILAPRNRIMPRCEWRLRFFVENEQVVEFVGVVIFKLIYFLLRNRPHFRQWRSGRMVRVLVQAIYAEL